MEYARNLTELYKYASLFWPKELIDKEAAASVLPLLLKTQDKFISLLNFADARPDAWKEALKASAMPSNLFLKHLMVLADFGGEKLKRIRPSLNKWYPEGIMKFFWKGEEHKYVFKAILSTKSLDNLSLGVDGEGLITERDLDNQMEDVAMLILHGGASTNSSLPDEIAEKCIIGGLIGQQEELNKFVHQRYILVSRITTGATANRLGQMVQDRVKSELELALPSWEMHRNGTIPGISQNAGDTNINFDIVAVSPKFRHVAIEVCFQVTTNSTIERKAGQAEARANLLHSAGHHIAYVIDGAGNFERRAALGLICKFSDCTIAFSSEEIQVLVDFLNYVG